MEGGKEVDIRPIDTDNAEFQEAFALINYTRQSVFLTGKAGTGKSTFLRYICSHTKKKFVVLAPTGVAAIHAGGTTIHSFFKMPFRPILPDDPDLSLAGSRIFDFLKYRKAHRKLLKEVELIIIDEISMVRADMIDFIDRVLRVYSGNMRLPFGGKQLLFVGDVYQLEPVVTSDARDILNRFYPNASFFSARVFSEIRLVPIELRKVYRQTDRVFIGLLDRIRTGQASAGDLNLLNERCRPHYEVPEDEFSITLATRRDQVDYINEKRLAALDGKSFVFTGEIQGDFPESSLPTQRELVLKKGAQVIFIKNDYDRRWVNGTIGRVEDISADGILRVVLENGVSCEVGWECWRNIRYTYDEGEKRIKEEELGSFIQYPVRLAWAITVHKSQGLTFSQVVIDFTGGAFAGGQTYVALSRCTSLEGIVLKKPVSASDIFVRPEIVRFSRIFNNRQLIDSAMKEAHADRKYAEASRLFDQGEFGACLDAFFEAIHARYDIEKPVARRFIQKKLNSIKSLQEQNRTLREQLQEQRSVLRNYAYEYYLLGNECIVSAHDSRAALANFDKALALDPHFTDAWIRKGVTLYDMEDYHEAARCLNEAVRLSPRSFKALYNRGKLRMKTEDYEGASSDLLKAIAVKPTYATAHDRLGDVFARLDKPDLASKYWDKAAMLREKKKKE